MSDRRKSLRKTLPTDVLIPKQMTIENNEPGSLRRSSRKIKKNLKYSSPENISDIANRKRSRSPRNSRKSKKASSEDELSSASEEFDDENDQNVNNEENKASEILFEDKDVAGKKMFGFQTPKKRGGMAQKVTEAINSPALQTPKKPESQTLPAKTPHAIRSKMKKEIEYLVRDDDTDSNSDFSVSGSDYKPYDASSSDASESSNSSSESDDKIQKPQPIQRLTNARIIREKKDLTYTMKTDEYFASQTNKNITSNHTLQKLKNPKLSEDQLAELLSAANLNVSSNHEKSIKELCDISCADFPKWMDVLNEGFSVLLYGLGSKRNILGQFQNELLAAKYPVIVVNGYFPSLTIKDIIDGILELLEKTDNSSNIFDCVDIIKDDFRKMPNLHLYLIVHNIDGDMLRNDKSQNVLSHLAAINNIHLVASIDHINTPIMWDHSKLSKFNFTWWDATSLLPYTDETSFESSLLVQKSGALVLSSISSVYQSLTKNSKGVFMLIVKYQLSKRDEKHYQGMPFKILYLQCRENFLVSSDLALRAQLTEFLDHKLVKSRRSGDGTEQLVIPINNSILQQFSEEVSNN